mmetsp:Transcript_6305/g.10282  ORF Transcript_6305/g.10282 Transcript_6305/m.10282 type:complete len:91 (-) Transcript_6305:194-466(-)
MVDQEERQPTLGILLVVLNNKLQSCLLGLQGRIDNKSSRTTMMREICLQWMQQGCKAMVEQMMGQEGPVVPILKQKHISLLLLLHPRVIF